MSESFAANRARKYREEGDFSIMPRSVREAAEEKAAPDGNPNPYRFKIIRSKSIRGKDYKLRLVAEIQYLDCTNYEGRKILVYKGFGRATLKKQTALDPHFCKNKKFKHPFARFEPTIQGWQAACALAKII